MSLTPMDIHNQEFERSFRGYATDDVDDFLDRLAKDMEQLIRESAELKEQIDRLKEKNASYEKLEETLQSAIMVAQEAADEVKQSANREADLIRREAEREAQRIVEDARYRASRILVENEDLHKQAQIFKTRFRSFMEAQLAALEMEEWLEDKEEGFQK